MNIIFSGLDLLVKTSRTSNTKVCDKLQSMLKHVLNYVIVFDVTLQTESQNFGIFLLKFFFIQSVRPHS